jgi:endonuclease/exonuclease/phosphatase family metal-dependent hydrolase
MVVVSPKLFTAPATLPSVSDQLSVLSYNVLLPNSSDGWWNYKMYSHSNSLEIDKISTWDYRRELIKNKIKTIDPDVVCVQEVSPVSFEEDFAFMEELGYDGVEMFKRGRFRPATFWRSSKCKLAHPPVHKDRTLLTAFHLDLPDDHQHKHQVWHVLNCHLQAGPQGPRRVRQIDEGVSASFKLAKKLKEKDPRSPLLVVCGDFNGSSECGAVRYLEDGSVDSTFIEDGEPVASREKKCPLNKPMLDVISMVDRPEPPTLVVAELISQMVKDSSSAYEEPEFNDDMISRLTTCYVKYATQSDSDEIGVDGKVMCRKDVEKWLLDINKALGRGSEFRCAAKEMGWTEPPQEEGTDKKDRPPIVLPEDGILTLTGFLNVYTGELRGGKFWGIAYDCKVMGVPLPDKGCFEARFDRMYCSDRLVPSAIVDTISTVPCPNENEPSDHLPVAASFAISDLN